MPGLVWNTMMSMSGGWFFVVASEAISVGDTTWKLPGIGSYVAMAIDARDIGAVLWAIGAMLVVIILYGPVACSGPLVAWSAKFRFEMTASEEAEDPWLLKLLRRTRLLRRVSRGVGLAFNAFGGLRLAPLRGCGPAPPPSGRRRALGDAAFIAVLAAALGYALWEIVGYVSATLEWSDLWNRAGGRAVHAAARRGADGALATVVWVPVGRVARAAAEMGAADRSRSRSSWQRSPPTCSSRSSSSPSSGSTPTRTCG